ncbi:hypothetical protein VTL71DRAFT_16046 [Oculimacula yallundae]|uniref:Uncharacterized protein n=1 Tax=Oculimacula yallundae TaxID=86028 RepID=A0ABR4CDC2_9HELO
MAFRGWKAHEELGVYPYIKSNNTDIIIRTQLSFLHTDISTVSASTPHRQPSDAMAMHKGGSSLFSLLALGSPCRLKGERRAKEASKFPWPNNHPSTGEFYTVPVSPVRFRRPRPGESRD